MSRYGSEADCVNLLFQARWPNGFSCPCCGHTQACTVTTRRLPLYECRRCARQTSPTAGTILEKTRTPIAKWLYAMYLVSLPDHGVNAVELAARISVTYKTAFAMLRKIRLAISAFADAERLSGHVQAGLTPFQRLYLTARELSEEHPRPVVTSLSVDERGQPHQVKMVLLPPGHLEHRCWLPIGQRDFKDRFVSPDTATVSFAFSSLLTHRHCKSLIPYHKAAYRWMNDTFRGLGIRYLQSYLDEFVYRVNCRLRGQSAFDSLIRLSVGVSLPA